MSKKYTREALLAAVSSNLDSKTAANDFHVPASTIRQHRRSTFLHDRVGRPSYLTADQEAHFVSLLQLLPEYGFEITKDLALQLAAEYFQSLYVSIKPGSKWIDSFVKRHSHDIMWKKQEKLEKVRADSFNEEVRTGWFATLKEVMTKHNLFDKPNQIFNVDESGFSDKTRGQWVIVNSSCRHMFESSGGTGKDYRTAVICISAGGQVLSPFLIFAGKNLMSSWCKGGPEGSHYAVTNKGWINTQMFEYWLEHVFIPSTAHLNRPLMLIMDGHASHISLKILNLLRTNNIICLMLPSHCTHALQPLDVVLFNSVKLDWAAIVRNHLKNGNKTVKNTDFARLIKILFINKNAFSPPRIVSSFARSEVWPFDQHAMRDKVAQNITNSLTTTSSTASIIPTNILQPRAATSISSPSLSSTTSLSSTAAVSSPATTTTIATIDAATNAQTSNLFDPVSPHQTTIEDENDILFPSSSESTFTMPQLCPLDLTISRPEKRKTPTNSTQNRKLMRSTTDPDEPCTPITAVRRVMNTLISERARQFQENSSQSKVSRGKRLPNKTGLNITDDDLIYTKVKEDEEKKNYSQQSSLEGC